MLNVMKTRPVGVEDETNSRFSQFFERAQYFVVRLG